MTEERLAEIRKLVTGLDSDWWVKDAIAQLLAHLDAVRAEREEAEGECETLQLHLESSVSEVKALEEELTDLRSSLATLTRERAEWERECLRWREKWQDEVGPLVAEVTKLRTDKARLDWLVDNLEAVYPMYDGRGARTGAWAVAAADKSGAYDTPRAAIDGAMSTNSEVTA